MKTIFIYSGAWLGLVILAIINGALRVKAYGPFMDELTAHQISSVTGLILFGMYIWFLTGISKIATSGQAIAIGGIWLCMTVMFEFVFGHYVMGHSWAGLFADYNVLKGRMWILVLIWTAAGPYIFYRIRSKF